MTSDTAQILARHVATEQKSAIHNAVRGEAWTEFLMYANGFTVDEAQLAVSCFNNHLNRDSSMEEVRNSAGYAKLKPVLEKREMPRPT
jgi:hypothetical protein